MMRRRRQKVASLILTLQMAASQGDAFTFLAGTNLTAFKTQIDGYPALYAEAIAEVKALRHESPADGALIQLYNDNRKGGTFIF
jgi:hypothetical protein